MHIFERAHAYHRVWRYRLRTEQQEIAYLLSRDLHGDTVADVGANRGIYSYWMHEAVAPGGNVVAFEPRPELAAYLRELKTALGLARLTVVEAALSSGTGERRLVRPRIHWGAGSLELEPGADRDALGVATTTLDEYFLRSPLRPLRFIKADIQGHEYACFVGGERLLREDRPGDPMRVRVLRAGAGPFLPDLARLRRVLLPPGRASADRRARAASEHHLRALLELRVPPAGARRGDVTMDEVVHSRSIKE